MESHSQEQINKLSIFLLKNYSHEFGRNKDPRGESAVDLAIRILTPTIPPRKKINEEEILLPQYKLLREQNELILELLKENIKLKKEIRNLKESKEK